MTLKFESEILFDLMKRDGDDAPSDVLPYESELKEKYLNQVVGAYPKLQDYRPEWLNYNLYHHLPSDFPTESVTNVTSASFHNVVPYAYRSAILTGNTLVNLITVKNATGGVVYTTKDLKLTHELPVGKYIFMYDVLKENTSSGLGMPDRHTPTLTFDDGTKTYQGFDGFNTSNGKKYWIINATKPIIKVEYWLANLVEDGEVDNLRLFAYQDGMENWDIPYFTGMQSVKMPVLTTTGKNLFDGNLIGGYFNNNISSIVGDGGKYKSIIIKLNKGAYTLSFERPVYIIREIIDGVYNQNTRTTTTYTFTLNTDGYYGISFREAVSETIWSQTQVMIEQGTVATSYEPYKTNILTVNEDVTLRGIGEVQDTLDLMTGELTQRVEEFRCEVKRVTVHGTNMVGNTRFLVELINPCPTFKDVLFNNHNFIYNPKSYNYGANGEFYFNRPTEIFLTFEPSKYTADTLKTYLEENPLILIIQLETESVKTVDLTCINEQGESETLRPIEGTMHVNTSSQTLPPLLDMSVPVEATSQNLMSFANIVEEEK